MAVKDILRPTAEQLRSDLTSRADKVFSARGITSAAIALEMNGIPTAKSQREDAYLRVIAGFWIQKSTPTEGEETTITPEDIESAFGESFDVSRIQGSIKDIREKLGPKEGKRLPNAHLYDKNGIWTPEPFDRENYKSDPYR